MVHRYYLYIVISICILQIAHTQTADSLKHQTKFSSNIAITNNGISLVPTFTLGKPATVINLSVSKGRLSFEPELRFAFQEARPWSFIYWMRYKIVKSNTFNLHVGVHPSFVFTNSILVNDSISKEVTLVKRYWAGELAPSMKLSKKSRFGIYYLHAYGLGSDITKHSQLLALHASISDISLSKRLYLKYNPQLFYLKLDALDGYYFTQTITLAVKDWPFSLSSITTKTIKSQIPSKDFVWNVSLNYTFN